MEPTDESLEPLIKVEYVDVGELCLQQNEPTEDEGQDASNDPSSGLMLDFAGPCDFNFSFKSEASSPFINSWLYSECLNQVFIRMGNVMHIQFNVDLSKAPSNDLFIRAMPVYASADYMHIPVNRCTLHSLEDDPLVEAHKGRTCLCGVYKLAGHVIRSTSSHAIYCYDLSTERHSVLVPIKHGLHDLLFSFACKSSCSRGMERRPIRVVFTLEDGGGLTLGRCSLNVKICSCPKRDKGRSEREFLATDGGRLAKKRRVPDEPKNGIAIAKKPLQQVPEKPLVTDPPVNGENTSQLVKLKMDLFQAKSHIAKLHSLCSSIEEALASLDSDI